MLNSVLIGLPAGARSLTPLAAVSDAAARGALPGDGGWPRWLGSPPVRAATALLAAGELLGDKLPSAPDRIVLAGLIVRVFSAGLAGAALAPRRRAYLGAVLGASGALVSAHLTFRARRSLMRRYGQTSTGVVEDALTVAAAWLIVRRT